jgi:kumamolisin
MDPPSASEMVLLRGSILHPLTSSSPHDDLFLKFSVMGNLHVIGFGAQACKPGGELSFGQRGRHVMDDRKVFYDSVIPIPDQPGLAPNGLLVHAAGPDNPNEIMTLHFSLEIPKDKQSELEARVARGDVISAQQLQDTYTPNAADVEALKSWLQREGFQITHVSPDNTSIYAQATIAQIEKSLAVNVVRVTKGGFTYSAARNAPSLPSDVGKSVRAIIGLQPFRQMHKGFKKRLPRDGNRTLSAVKGPPTKTKKRRTLVLSPNVANAPPYLVDEILRAYNADGLSVTGKGQTIAILIDTVPLDSDLKSFWNHNNRRVTLKQIEKINVKGGELPPPEGEETLDVEWASGIAPGAKVRIYATGTLSFVDLDLALDRILTDLPSQPGMRQLSISLGLGETYFGGAQGEVATQNQKFLRLAAAGVNTFVSSGDAGSNPDETGHSATGPTQVEFESSDLYVVGVGGTSLKLAANGDVASEVAWANSGGGVSIFFNRPAWQKGNGVLDGDKRLVPDVCLAADPDEGAFLILQGQVQQIGGTSWSAPVWAGFCALINEARAKAQQPPLPFLNPLIYPLIGTPCFRDITSGTNGAYYAGPGYDMVTGIGAPNVRELIRALAPGTIV